MVADTIQMASFSAAEMAARVRRREVSPVELVDACIRRIEERNPSLNAFVYFGFDDARALVQPNRRLCRAESSGHFMECLPR
jgi:amidase/aspartyl-tRNA(Asn)/glutamyl-tRNA(Gln) amidotransferase subunit A